jgi:hypothetical protein
MADLSEQHHVALLEALAVTAELTGTEVTEAAARVMSTDLAAYPLPQVLAALTRCRRELKGRLTIAAVIERLDDGRPGPEEAWSMIPMDETGSVVWTEEMSEAYGVGHRLIGHGDHVGARMAFKEAYNALVAKARAEQRPVRWMPSLGHDPAQRAAALAEAVRKGRLSESHAANLLPGPDRDTAARALLKLEGPRSEIPEHVQEQFARLKLKLVNGGKR